MEIEIPGTNANLQLEDPQFHVDANLEIGKIDAAHSNPAAELRKQTGSVKWSQDKFTLDFSSGLEIEVINKHNPHSVRGDEDEGEELLPPYPWSHGEVPAALAYRVVANVESGYESGEFPIGTGGKASFGFEANSRVESTYIVRHAENETLGKCISDDIGNGSDFRYARSAAAATGLATGEEFLLTRYQGAFAFSANTTWGQVFRSNPGLIRELFPADSAIAFKSRAEEEIVELGVSAQAGIGIRLESAMELVASTVEYGGEKFSRIAFRKAASSSTKASGGFSVKASLPDTDSAMKALAQLISLRTGIDETVEEIERALASSCRKIEALRGGTGWVETKLEGLSDGVISDAKTIVAAWDSDLNATVNDWLGLGERLGKVDRTLAGAAERLGLTEKLGGLMNDLVDRAATLDSSGLPNLEQDLLRTILGSSDYGSQTPLSLASFLGIDHFRSTLIAKVAGAEEHLVDSLRVHLLAAAELTGLHELLEGEAETKLFALVENATGFSLSSLLADVASRKLLREKTPAGIGMTADELLGRVADAILEKAEPLDGVVDWLGKNADLFPEFLENALIQVSRAVPRDLEISVRMEYERVRQREVMMSFDYRHEVPGFEPVYEHLVAGNWRAVLDDHRERGGNSGPYRDFQFFFSDEVHERIAFKLRAFGADFSQEAINTRRSVTTDGGEVRHSLLTEGRWNIVIPRDENKKKVWNGFVKMTAETPGFLPASEVTGRSFEFRYESGISCWGITALPKNSNQAGGLQKVLKAIAKIFKDDKKLVAENSGIILAIASRFDEKLPGSVSAWKTIHQAITAGAESIRIDFNLSIEPETMSRIWEKTPPGGDLTFPPQEGDLLDAYMAAWPEVKLGRDVKDGGLPKRVGAEKKMTDAEYSNLKQYFERLTNLAKTAQGNADTKELYGSMKKWRFGTNRAGSAPDKLDKICYPLSMLAVLPEDGLGWSASAVVTIGDERYYFG